MKALVVAASRHRYRQFIETFNLYLPDYRWIEKGDLRSIAGIEIDTPAFILEGYQYNRYYTLEFMELLGLRFHCVFIPDSKLRR